MYKIKCKKKTKQYYITLSILKTPTKIKSNCIYGMFNHKKNISLFKCKDLNKITKLGNICGNSYLKNYYFFLKQLK